MASQAFEELVDRAFTDEEFAKRLQTDRESAIAEYALSDDEKSAIMSIGKRYGAEVQGYQQEELLEKLGVRTSAGTTDTTRPTTPKITKIVEVLKCSF